jgi:hypothetical protein
MQKMKKLFLVALAIIIPAVASMTGAAYAAPSPGPTTNCGAAADINTDPSKGATVNPIPRQCDPALKDNNCSNINSCGLIKDYIQPAVDFLAAFVGVAVVISIIYGGIEYGSSGGDPQKAQAGKNRIRNSLVALLAFFFLYALLRFALLPSDIGTVIAWGTL